MTSPLYHFYLRDYGSLSRVRLCRHCRNRRAPFLVQTDNQWLYSSDSD